MISSLAMHLVCRLMQEKAFSFLREVIIFVYVRMDIHSFIVLDRVGA